jgi:hypothetical protein
MTERERLIDLIGQSSMWDLKSQPLLIEQIADYLLANGVIVPPIAVGGTVYTYGARRVKEWKVHFVGRNTQGETKFHLADKGFQHMIEAWNYDIGHSIFLSREEAEKALAERRKG